MDLFFYREPEEPKEQEGDEVVAAPDYGITDYQPPLGGEWATTGADAQWSTDGAAGPPISSAPGAITWDQGQNY